MNEFIDWISQAWPWYVAGPMIGFTVPALLIVGNKTFGISSSLRHVCAACVPAGIPFFTYDWKKEIWNLIFLVRAIIGGYLANTYMNHGEAVQISQATINDLAALGFGDPSTSASGVQPDELFAWENVLTLRGFLILAVAGLLVGFGTRYAGGCTSGHAISGLSDLQIPSLIAVIGFFTGGLIMTHLLYPLIF